MLSIHESLEPTVRGVELPPYGDPQLSALYWDARHARVTGAAFFDWYLDYTRLRGIFLQELPAPSESGPEILDVGFGTSEIPSSLFHDGYHFVTAIDVSIPSSLFHDGYHFVTAIDVSAESVRLAQQRRSSEQKSLQFLQMNATRMSFPDECFHAVFDKATLDTLLCSHQGAAEAYLSEVFRVLQPGGIFLLISHSGPAERLPYLLRLNSAQEAIRPWKVQVAQLPKSDGGDLDPHEGEDDRANSCFWLFLCTKPPVNSESF